MSGAIITNDNDKSVLSQKVVTLPSEMTTPPAEMTIPPAEAKLTKAQGKVSFYDRHKLLLLMIVFILIIYLFTGSAIKTITIGTELFMGFGVLAIVIFVLIFVYVNYAVGWSGHE
jgi:hypothetical protein